VTTAAGLRNTWVGPVPEHAVAERSDLEIDAFGKARWRVPGCQDIRNELVEE
jgi:hypothetical protein